MFNTAKDGLTQLLESSLSADVLEPIEALRAELEGRETDDFGFCPQDLKWVLPFVIFLYRHWFRVEVYGIDNLPAGRSLYIANHSGQVLTRARRQERKNEALRERHDEPDAHDEEAVVQDGVHVLIHERVR